MRDSKSNGAVFLDKDGTLVDDVPYNVDPRRVRLADGVVEGLCALQSAGYPLIVISNQSGIARGYFTEDELQRAFEQIQRLLQPHGVLLDAFYYCPHHPQGVVEPYNIECDCRKPRPGLIVKAAYEHDIHLGDSWFVGDILDDVEAGQRAGCRTVFLNKGSETEWSGGPYRWPNQVAGNFREAARVILERQVVPDRR